MMLGYAVKLLTQPTALRFITLRLDLQ